MKPKRSTLAANAATDAVAQAPSPASAVINAIAESTGTAGGGACATDGRSRREGAAGCRPWRGRTPFRPVTSALAPLLLLALLLAGQLALAQSTFSGANLELSLDAQGRITHCAPEGDPALIGALGVYLYDGVAGSEVEVTPVGASPQQEGLALAYQTAAPVQFGAFVLPRGEALLVTLVTRNTGDFEAAEIPVLNPWEPPAA